MSEDPERQLSINVATGVNAMAVMAAAIASSDPDFDPVEYFNQNLSTVVEGVLAEHAVRVAQANFPSSTLEPYQPAAAPMAPQTGPAGGSYVPPQQATVVPAGVPQPQVVSPVAPAPAPAPIPGVTDGDPIVANFWVQFFTAHNAGQVATGFKAARNGQWFDNRAGKSPRAPDFKVKGEKGEDTPALWSNDKKNPSWVAQELANRGLQ